jgi:hypothetical protein
VVASNVGSTNTAYCKLGASATVNDQPISPNGGWFAFTTGGATQLTCITSTSTTTVNMVGGAGLPTGAGGGSSGGSGSNASVSATGSAVPSSATYIGIISGGNLTGWTGAVTQVTAANLNATVVGTGTFATQSAITAASGSISAGAISAGAYVSGSVLSGAYASGSLVDITNVSTPISPNTATATKGLLIGGQFNSTQETLTNGQQGQVALSSRGALFVATGADVFNVANTGTFVAQVNGFTSWAGGTLGAMANYGTSPGAVLVPGVNSFVTNTVAANATLQSTPTTAIGKVDPNTIASWGLAVSTQNVSSPTNALLVQGQFNTSPTTITSGNASPLQLDNAGNLLVNVKAGGGSGGTSSSFGATFPSTGTAIGMSQGGNMVAFTGTSNNLNVQCANCSGSGVSTIDEAAFTAGSSLFVGGGGFFQTTATSNALTSGQQGMFQVTANRALFTNLRNASGTEIGTSSNPVQVSVANTGANGTAMLVTGTGGTFPVTQSLAQGSTTSGQNGALVFGAVTTSNPSYTTAQSDPLSLDTAGGLRIVGEGTAGTATGGVVTVQGVASMTPVQVSQATASNLNATVVGTGTFAVQAAQSGTWTVQPGNTANTTAWLMNVGQFGGNNVVTGTGASGSGIPRVTISNDSSLAANQSVNVAQVAGAAPSVTNPLWVAGAQAASVTMQNGATANGNGTTLAVSGYQTALVNVNCSVACSGGTTINFEGTDSTGTYFSLSATPVAGGASVTTATTSGQFWIPVSALTTIRARISAYSAGTITVTGTSENGINPPATVTALQATAANLNATVVGSGTAGSAAGGVLTIQGVASMTPVASNITQVLGSALSATNGLYTNLLQGNAVLSVTNPSFTEVTDGSHGAANTKAASTPAAATDIALVVDQRPGTGDACNSAAAKSGAPISLTASAQVITGTASKKTYICSIDLVSATAQNIALVEGTGTTCATNIFGLAGGTTAATGWNFAANGGLTKGSGNGTVYSPSADTNATAANVCLLLSSTGQTSGQITFVQQ